MKRKTILLAMLGAVSLASCNRQMGSSPSFTGGEICFGSKSLTVTKAVTESTTAGLEANGFKAAVVINESNEQMFNKEVSYNGGIYSVAGETYYYPLSGTISAYAAYPKSEVIIIENGVATLLYSQNDTEDLLVAKSTGISKQNEPISLTFDHVLSRVSFKAKGTDAMADYKLKTIEVTAPDGGTYQYADGTWTDLGQATVYTAYSSAGESVPTSDFQSFGESMTFIPGDAAIRVEWECYNKVDGTLIASYDETVSTTFVQGERCAIRFYLPNNAADEIKLAVDVNPWDDGGKDLYPAEFVDLGLPSGLKWAKCNLGAEKESDYGLYFKFGETVGHSSDDLSYFDTAVPNVEVDTDGNLLAAYDAATAAYGAGFRMPTEAEAKELKENTDKSLVTINGVKGMKFAKKGDAGTYIFMPFSGYCVNGEFRSPKSEGYFWCSTVTNDTMAYFLNWSSMYGGLASGGSDLRYVGRSIRVVHE